MSQNNLQDYVDILSKVFNENRWCFRRDLSEKEQRAAEIILENIYKRIYTLDNELTPYSPDTHKTGSYLIYFSFTRTDQPDINFQYMTTRDHFQLNTYQTAVIVRSFENPIKDPIHYIFENMDANDYSEHYEINDHVACPHLQPAFQPMLDKDDSILDAVNLPSMFSIPNEFNEALVFEVDESILLPLQKYLDHPISLKPPTLFANIPPAL